PSSQARLNATCLIRERPQVYRTCTLPARSCMIQGYEYSGTGAGGDTDAPSSWRTTRQLSPKSVESASDRLSRSASALLNARTNGPPASRTLPTAEFGLGSVLLTGSVQCAPASLVRVTRTRPGGWPA